MNRIIYIACLLIFHSAIANAQWVFMGSPGFSTGMAGYPSIAVDSIGVSYIAYADYSTDWKMNVRKFVNGNWVQVGSPNFSADGQALPLSLALDTNGTPYVAYYGDSLGYITIDKFDGSKWVQVGDSIYLNAIGTLSLIIARNNTLYVLYSWPDTNNEITVLTYSGSNWMPLGNSKFAALDNYPSFAIDNVTGQIYVVFSDDSLGTGSKATIMVYNNNIWLPLGSPRFTQSDVSYTAITIDNNGIPIIAFQGYEGLATAMKYDDSDWVTIGESGFSPGPADFVSVLVDSNNTPYVEYVDDNTGEINVMKFNGIEWELVGNPNFSDTAFNGATFAIDKNGTPYVAYSDYNYSFKATVMKYDSISSGIENVKSVGQLNVYPNPAQNIATIEWQPNATNEASVVIYDMLGREVSSQQISSGPSTMLRMTLDVSNLENGLYVVRVLSANGGEISGKLGVVK